MVWIGRITSKRNLNQVSTRYIVGVDINDGKFPLAQQMGAHECVNSIKCEGGDVKAWLIFSSFRIILFHFHLSII